ncbi:MAG: DUF177 domain-containing protein, partial [Clostridia bacterium]|nr:DUF177 domain-containing protein [Clostridia bacterium]
MKIDVTTLLGGRVSKLEFEYALDIGSAECDIIMPEEFSFPSPATVKGIIKDQNGFMSLTADVTVPYATVCDRCLDDVEGTLEFTIEKTLSTAAPPEGFEDDATYDEVLFISESSVDADHAVIEETALRLPPYHLCSEDCPGMCPKCGRRLKDGA